MYVRFSGFYINLHISFIYEDLFTIFDNIAYGYGNMSVKYFGLILNIKMESKSAIADCSKIIKMF